MENPEALVFQVGTETCRVGIAGEDDPREIFSSFCGRREGEEGERGREVLVGGKMEKEKEKLVLTSPMERGIVSDWELLEEIYSYAFTNTFSSISDLPNRPLLVIESPLTPPPHTQKNKEILFEKFGVPALSLAVDAVLALYATGKVCGVVVDSGATVTNVVPIFEGIAVGHGIARIEKGGRDVTDFITRLVTEEGEREGWETLGGEIIQTLKEKMGYIAIDFEEEERKWGGEGGGKEEEYILPDGKKVVVGRERYRGGELLFNPVVCGEGEGEGDEGRDGLGGIVVETVLAFEEEIGRELAKNVVLSGGNTLMKGFGERLGRDMEREVVMRWREGGGEGGEGEEGWVGKGEKVEMKVKEREGRQNLAYLGGSILSSLSSFQELWIAKEQYEEEGGDRKGGE